MTSITRIVRKEQTISDTALDQLVALVEGATTGDVTEFIGIAWMRGGEYRLVGGETLNRHRMLGALFDLAVTRAEQTNDAS